MFEPDTPEAIVRLLQGIERPEESSMAPLEMPLTEGLQIIELPRPVSLRMPLNEGNQLTTLSRPGSSQIPPNSVLLKAVCDCKSEEGVASASSSARYSSAKEGAAATSSSVRCSSAALTNPKEIQEIDRVVLVSQESQTKSASSDLRGAAATSGITVGVFGADPSSSDPMTDPKQPTHKRMREERGEGCSAEETGPKPVMMPVSMAPPPSRLAQNSGRWGPMNAPWLEAQRIHTEEWRAYEWNARYREHERQVMMHNQILMQQIIQMQQYRQRPDSLAKPPPSPELGQHFAGCSSRLGCFSPDEDS